MSDIDRPGPVERGERVERLAETASNGLRSTLQRLGKLVGAVFLVALAVGGATFATGWWVFDGGTGWIVVGGVLCLVPVAAAVTAWFFVRATASAAPRLLDDVRSFLRSPGSTAAGVLIDHDSGVALGMQARSFGGLRRELLDRRKELPALFAGVRAITGVPGLAAIAVLGTVGVGALGTILLLVGALGS
jgi:hypothetical protein